jgi:DNA-binding transcriptional LysR family regulator
MHLRELDANLLVVLDALLQDSSVTKAADRLGRSPSAVSHALANLRQLFEDELFVRAGQKLVPTARAMQVSTNVREVVARMEQLLIPDQAFDPATVKRTFTFAANEACELTLLHILRGRLKDRAPNIHLDWNLLRSHHVNDELRDGVVQFLLTDKSPNQENAADFIWQPLFEEEYVTLARPGHPLSDKKLSKQQFADADHIMITSTDGCIDELREHYRDQGIEPNVTIEASNIFSGLFLALDSYTLISVPASIARAVRKRMPFTLITQPFTPLTIKKFLGWHKALDNDEGHLWLRNEIMDLVRDTPR